MLRACFVNLFIAMLTLDGLLLMIIDKKINLLLPGDFCREAGLL
jgi:hypothetical protein